MLGQETAYCELIYHPIRVGRQAFRLDEQEARPSSAINIALLTCTPDRSGEREAIDVEVHSAEFPDTEARDHVSTSDAASEA